MQLPPFLIPKPQNPVPSQQPQLPELEESDRFRFIKNLNSLCGQGFWFSVGVSIAHVSRIASVPVGSGAVLLLAGFLLLVRPKNPTPYLLSMRRISGLLLVLGVLIAFWDTAWLFATLPLNVGFGAILLGQLVAIVCLALALAWGWSRSRRWKQ